MPHLLLPVISPDQAIKAYKNLATYTRAVLGSSLGLAWIEHAGPKAVSVAIALSELETEGDAFFQSRPGIGRLLMEAEAAASKPIPEAINGIGLAMEAYSYAMSDEWQPEDEDLSDVYVAISDHNEVAVGRFQFTHTVVITGGRRPVDVHMGMSEEQVLRTAADALLLEWDQNGRGRALRDVMGENNSAVIEMMLRFARKKYPGIEMTMGRMPFTAHQLPGFRLERVIKNAIPVDPEVPDMDAPGGGHPDRAPAPTIQG